MGGRVMRLKIDDIVDESEAIGKAEGVKEATETTVINMLKEGLGVDMISRINQLSIDQITVIGKQAVLL